MLWIPKYSKYLGFGKLRADWCAEGGAIYTDSSPGASSLGVACPTSTTVNVKGTYTTVIAATTFRAQGFHLHVIPTNSTDYNHIIDIAIGAAAAEQIILPNLLYGPFDAWRNVNIYVPLELPAGVRVAARVQSSTAGASNSYLDIIPAVGEFNMFSGLNAATDYGTTLASTTGISVDPGAVGNTKGAWAQITASTTSNIKALLFQCVTTPGTAYGSVGAFANLFDIGVGAAGSEQVIVPNIPGSYSGATFDPGGPHQPIWVNIPSGTRLAVRAQSNLTTTPQRIMDVSIIGLN